ncbi:DUF4961 domain-containing protein [Jiulongibacter sp. NS-SX5]|uniref:DUF4961 domain-containing protein n=1 Tax=Jiulongibacter sp. NS-SX5 TaxID=3463854 RepID=UPI00405A23E1
MNIKLYCFLLILSIPSFGQIVKILPQNAGPDEPVEIIYDATEGTAGLVGESEVYMHSGVVLSGPAGTGWEYVKGNWGNDDGIGEMTKVEGEENLWSIKLSSIRQYYGVPTGTPVFRLAMVFRNGFGTKEGKGTPGAFEGGSVAANQDIFLNLNVSNYVQIASPLETELFKEKGSTQTFNVKASGVAKSLKLEVNAGKGFEEVRSVDNAQTLNYDYQVNASEKLALRATAIFEADTQQVTKDFKVNVLRSISGSELPAGLKKGINYLEDETRATLVLEAPGKSFAYVVGDFTNWEVREEFQMTQTEDKELFFLEIDNLTAGQEYVFQYWVDGTIKIGDPYADKVADPWNDSFIPESVYPNLPPYDKQDFGIATVLQTGQQPFDWAESEKTFSATPDEELVIYELLIRDFIGSHDYKDLADTLSYLKTLGVNAIELMPIMEFEGNESWGYNPSYFFAPDKYYGSKNDLKNFIQTAHQQGFTVLLDMVLNHAFGQNALVKLNWNNALGRPTAESPWFNEVATHPFNVGFDFNHESPYTQAFVDSVNAYWLTEYHFDGYRFDLSKGFTQRQNTDVGRWSSYDESRAALLKRMASKIKEIDPEAILILEHFGDNREENELQAAGMLTWGNSNHDVAEAMKGNTGITLTGLDDSQRVSYLESHDEQRQMYWIDNASIALKSTYDPRDFEKAINRLKMMTAFFYTQPGPKMMWQFQELGYDIDINFNGRVGNKPLVWGEGSLNYNSDAERQKLYKTHAALINLVNDYKTVFTKGTLTKSMTGAVKTLSIDHEEMGVVIVGNFDIQNASKSVTFIREGWWYDLFEKDSVNVTGAVDFDLSPGEFHVFTTQKHEVEDSLVTFFEARDTVIVNGPVVTVSPEAFQPETEITITFDAKESNPAGTAGLVGASKVYMHAGIITSSESGTDWQYVIGNWGDDDGLGQMTQVPGEPNKWQITITPKNYFSAVPSNATWFRIGMVFRNADGTREGKGTGATDIFVNFTEGEKPVLGNEFNSRLKVFPNPTADQIKLETTEEIESWTLANLKGIKVLEGKEKSIKVSHLPYGMYLLKVKSEHGLYTQKVLIR